MKKNSKGITLVSLVIVIVVMLIIAGITLNVSFERFEINNLKKMLSDLELLEDKVANHYLKYNTIPIVRNDENNAIKYTFTTIDFEKSAGDNENYYIIDLKELDGGVSLNYGKDGFENPNNSNDVYIINEQSHNIYYAKGIKMKEKYYYSHIDKSNIEDTIPPSKPEIKIISGTKNEEGIYITEVKLEIIPGKDNWSGVSKTEYSINNGSTWNDLSENNILTLLEEGNYDIIARTHDKKNNVSTTEKLSLQLKMSKKITVGQIVDNNCTINGEDYSSSNPVIPAGFMAINTETSSWDAEEGPQVSNGLVISDGVSEFVWIPIRNKVIEAYGVNSSNDREPDVVTGVKPESATSAGGKKYDAISANLKNAGLTEDLNKDGQINAHDFKQQLTNEFETMAKSVNKYGGFYVGRYEVSNNSGKAQSVKGATSANASESTSKTWYGLYNLCKTYNMSSVKSSMIWGSQYDAIMTFIGNAANTTIDGANTGRDTGNVETDKIKNIYDLYGNSYEWTLEARGASGRLLRGGYYNTIKNPNNKSNNTPTSEMGYYGSRLTLYVELEN